MNIMKQNNTIDEGRETGIDVADTSTYRAMTVTDGEGIERTIVLYGR